MMLIVNIRFCQGDNGYCYIPYDYLANTDYCFDVWTIRKLETDDFGQDHWDQDDSTDYREMNDGNDDNDGIIQDFDNDDYFDDGGKEKHIKKSTRRKTFHFSSRR